ncbi:Fe-S-containing protein [Maridesulfovibrio sp. FT414]|uniref:Fe-S-containing protein n=1 Tax=Maridesulfovibrio sp. FT414 TaxID=2979469 RepID=UPI003D805733
MKKLILLLVILLVPSALFAGMKLEGNKAIIPLEEVSDSEAHYYSMNVDNTNVRFFVLKSKDGVIRAAFDACDVCYHSGKGYSQDGDFMVCNNCGMRFHSTRINIVSGGCNPSPLERTIEGQNLIISMDAIKSGKKYF